MENLTTQGAPIDAPSPASNDRTPAAIDALHNALTSAAARGALATMAGVVTIGALIGAAAAVFHLQSAHMAMWQPVAAFNAGIVALMPIALALGAAQAVRERTRAAMVAWLAVWSVTALALAALDGVMSAGAVVTNVQALTSIGRVLAPLPGALAVTTVAAIIPTLRGDDSAGALGGIWVLIAKTVVVLFSSAGLLNVAIQSDGVREQLYAVALASVVEVSFIALLTRSERSTAATALLFVLAGVLGLNAAESATVAFGFDLPAWLAWIPAAGRASIVLSGAVCVLAAVALSVKGGKATTRASLGQWAVARVADLRAAREAVAAIAPENRPTRRAVALAAVADDVAADVSEPGGDDDADTGAPSEQDDKRDSSSKPARAEVAPRATKSRASRSA